MPLDVDDILSQFGEKSKSKANPTAFDVDKLLSEFGGKSEKVELSGKPSAITVTPKPPISGISKEASDELNQTRVEKQGGENPRSKLPRTSIQDSMAEHGIAAKELLGSAANDAETGHPYKAIGKGLLGLVQGALSPVTGAIEGAVSTPITDITGNKDIGDRAGIVANSVMPVPKGLSVLNKASAGLPVVNKLSTYPKNKALSQLIEHIGPENLPAAVAALKANPRLAPADLSSRVLQDTQNLFVTEGPHINYLNNTSAARLAGSKDTVNTALDASMGATVNAAQKVDELKNAAREIGKKNIEPVLSAKPHTDVTDLIKHIDSEIGYPAMKAIKEGKSPPLPLTDYQRELLNVRNKLRSTDWPDREKMFAYTDQLHDTQIKLREKAQGLTSSATGSERLTGKDLLSFREKMKDAVGPEYKEALGKYAGQKKVEEAFHNGYDTILSNSKKLENDPSFFEKWIESPSRKPGELEAAREGARLRIQHEIEAARTAATNPSSKAIGIGQTDFSVKRIEALLGKEEAHKLLNTLEVERKIANTHNKIIEGSQTAMRTASKEGRSLPTLKDIGTNIAVGTGMETANILAHGYPGVGTALLTSANLANRGAHSIKTKIAKEINSQYAKLALPTEGPSRDALIQSLEAAIPGPKQSIVRRGANTLSRLVAP